jgi:hypothetical protein
LICEKLVQRIGMIGMRFEQIVPMERLTAFQFLQARD